MLRIAYITIDSEQPRQLAAFWGQLLNADVTTEGDEAWLTAATDHGNGYVNILFVQNSDAKVAKNRLHLDLAPDDYQAQIDRALHLGATKADVGQTGEEPWTVMADPEGNEFCILQNQ